MSSYLERLLGDASERIKDRVLDARIATLEVLADEEALDDLSTSSRDPESDLRDYDEIRREVGLA